MRERDETVYQLVLKINEIQPDQWDEVDERDYRLIDAALRRAKAEGMKMAQEEARFGAMELRAAYERIGSETLRISLDALQDFADILGARIAELEQLDARAAQIENEATK